MSGGGGGAGVWRGWGLRADGGARGSVVMARSDEVPVWASMVRV